MIELLEDRRLLSRAWYVGTMGLDSNPGTLSQPFKTIQHAASLATAGDTVYIMGGTYHETITPAHSGTASAPITYKAYNNQVVTVDGANALTGWTLLSGSKTVYYTNQSWTLGEGNDQLFVNGVAMNEAEWPNSAIGAVKPPTATMTSVSSSALGTDYSSFQTATISVSGLPGGTDAWAGATIHFGAGQDWTVQTGTVLHSGNGTITFAYEHQTAYETPTAGNHFYLTGKYIGLDAAGEWYRDPTTGRVYLWAPNGTNPNTETVEAKARADSFNLSGLQYIDISNIHTNASTIITSGSSSHLILNNIFANYVSQKMLNPVGWLDGDTTTGILLEGSSNVLENSVIQHSSGNGVLLAGSYNTVQSCTIAYADYSGADAAGITLLGSHEQVLHNIIYDTGRDGILDSNSTADTIEYNNLYSIGLQTTDLGAIYDYGTNSQGTVIAYNTISNISTGGFGGDGIYLDAGSANYVVHNNYLTNVQIPIKLNGASFSNSVYNNTINGKVVANQSSGGGSPALGPATYKGSSSTLTTLGTLGGFQSASAAINNAGQVVGSSLAGASQLGYVYSGGKMNSISAFGSTRSFAAAINSSGQIAGYADLSNGAQAAFLDAAGSVKSLGALPGDTSSMADGINSSGQVVGVSYGDGAVGHAFLYSGGAMHALGTLGGSESEATAINSAGAVVGYSAVAGDRNANAFVYSGGKMKDLGTLGGSSSYAFAINTSGAIVGTSQIKGNGATHAFLSVGGYMHDLGTLSGYTNSVATGIDTAGSIVGYAFNLATGATRAWLYRNGKMVDLNSLLPANTGWMLVSAASINDNNQITGQATNSSGSHEPAFVLTLLG